MGEYVIIIRAQGGHHNVDEHGNRNERDADVMAEDFVNQLRENDHMVFSKIFCSSKGVENIYGSDEARPIEEPE